MARSGGAQPRSDASPSLHATAGDTHLALLDNEQEWVARIRASDHVAFSALFRAYYDPLCRFVEGIVAGRAIAEEVVQGVFLALWERRDTWIVRDRLRTYLFAVARNHALNNAKRDRLFLRYLARLGAWRESDTEWPRIAEGEARVSADEMESAVRRALAQLPSRYAQVLGLRWEHGMTYAEIAAILAVPVKTVETRAIRGLRLVRPKLQAMRT